MLVLVTTPIQDIFELTNIHDNEKVVISSNFRLHRRPDTFDGRNPGILQI